MKRVEKMGVWEVGKWRVVRGRGEQKSPCGQPCGGFRRSPPPRGIFLWAVLVSEHWASPLQRGPSWVPSSLLLEIPLSSCSCKKMMFSMESHQVVERWCAAQV